MNEMHIPLHAWARWQFVSPQKQKTTLDAMRAPHVDFAPKMGAMQVLCWGGKKAMKNLFVPHRITPNNIINSVRPHQNNIFNLLHPGNIFVPPLESWKALWWLSWLCGLRCALCFWYWRFRSALISFLFSFLSFCHSRVFTFQCLQSSTTKTQNYHNMPQNGCL